MTSHIGTNTPKSVPSRGMIASWAYSNRAVQIRVGLELGEVCACLSSRWFTTLQAMTAYRVGAGSLSSPLSLGSPVAPKECQSNLTKDLHEQSLGGSMGR